jgi:tetratricopeptide (TPR) repeat protein
MAPHPRALTPFAALLLALVLAACSLPAPYQPPPAPVVVRPPPAPVPVAVVRAPAPPPPPAAAAEPAPRPPAPPPPQRDIHLSAATRALVNQARDQTARGELPAASVTLDRALRIEPNNPLLWIELGRLRLAENDPHQAEGCGRKALALASGDPATEVQAGRLLADALRGQHRNQEARDLESQPWMN